MKPWPYPCIVADIGGTNIRFAQIDAPDAAFSDVLGTLTRVSTSDHPDLQSAIADWIARRPASMPRPLSCAVAIATPVTGERIRLTNNRFVVDRPATLAALGLESMRVLNDFEALAWSLPWLRDDDLVALGSALPSRRDTMVVLGPGTGLGCAGMLLSEGRWIPVPGEGGHVTQAAADDFDAAVLHAAREQFEHVSAERLLSGVGLPTLHAAVAQVLGRPLTATLDPAAIIQAAHDGSDDVAVRTLETFCAMLGTLAGNLALVYNAYGGVLIGGGIGVRVRTLLERSAFRARFVAKGRYRDHLAPIGTALITHEQPALLGLQHALVAG